jgi:hypothetical protein
MTEKKWPELVMFVMRSSFVPAGMEMKPSRRVVVEPVRGEVVAQSDTNDVSLLMALRFFYWGGWRVVSSYYEARKNGGYNLSFVLAERSEDQSPDINDEWLLFNLIEGSLWQVRVYKNPLFRDGKPVEGEFTLSVNCNARQPLYNYDGTPVMRWAQLANGAGDIKIPLNPAHILYIDGDSVSLVPVE